MEDRMQNGPSPDADLTSLFVGEETNDLVAQARIVADLYERKRGIKENLEILQSEYRKEEELLLLIMERDGVTSLKLGDSTIFQKEQTYVSVNREREMAALTWLKEQGYEHLIRETVNSRTLSSVYREMVELDINVPTELFNINPKKTVGVGKQTRKFNGER